MKLTPAQELGVQWIVQHWNKGRGCLLADEQGFGKTAQAVVAASTFGGRTLVLAPSSVLYQWQEAFTKWGMETPPFVYHRNAWEDGHQVVITTYETFKLHNIYTKSWEVAILDEGAKIKNAATDIFKAVSRLKTRRRLILSATPLQNDVKELYTLMSFVSPGLLGDEETFDRLFTGPLRDASRKNATSAMIMYGRQCGKVLAEQLAPYILRRHKHTIPMKQDVVFCTMKDDQSRLYTRLAHEHRRAFTKPERFQRELVLRSVVSGTHEEKTSNAKLDALTVLMEQQPNERFAVFVKHRATLGLLSAHLDLAASQCIDGTVSAKKRKEYIDAFESDPTLRIMCMTARTGGVGINLPGATRIVLFEPDFNPTVDDQAAYRSHRRGQTRAIMVYRLITKKTIEEAILRRQLEKTKEANMALPDSVQIGDDVTDTVDDMVVSTLFKRVSFDQMTEDTCLRMFPAEKIRTKFLTAVTMDKKRRKKRHKKERKLPLKIAKFILKRGVSTTEQLLKVFRPYVEKNNLDPRVFKRALRHVATYDPLNRVWTLTE